MNDQTQLDIGVYDELITYFKEISPQEAEKLIEEKSGNTIFISKKTCPYCRRFLPKLLLASEGQREFVYYVDSDDQTNLEDLQSLRDRFDIKTVPGLIYSNGDEVKTVCDSSLSVDAVKEYLK